MTEVTNFQVKITCKSRGLFHFNLKTSQVTKQAQLHDAFAELPPDVVHLTLEEAYDANSYINALPSFDRFHLLSRITLIGMKRLTKLPDISEDALASRMLILNISACPMLDVTHLPDTLLEINIKSHSDIDVFRCPLYARMISFKNTRLGVIHPPLDAHTFRPLRGHISFSNSQCVQYPRLMKILNEPVLTGLEDEDCDIDMDDLTILANQSDRSMLRMYEAYNLIAEENRHILRRPFIQLKHESNQFLCNIIDSVSSGKEIDPIDCNNLQELHPIARASTLASNPLRRALEFV